MQLLIIIKKIQKMGSTQSNKRRPIHNNTYHGTNPRSHLQPSGPNYINNFIPGSAIPNSTSNLDYNLNQNQYMYNNTENVQLFNGNVTQPVIGQGYQAYGGNFGSNFDGFNNGIAPKTSDAITNNYFRMVERAGMAPVGAAPAFGTPLTNTINQPAHLPQQLNKLPVGTAPVGRRLSQRSNSISSISSDSSLDNRNSGIIGARNTGLIANNINQGVIRNQIPISSMRY